MTIFEQVTLAPRDPILGVTEAFKADDRPHKANLGVGVYTDESGRVPLLECVKQAEARIAADAAPHVYLPIDGLPSYNAAVKELVFGPDDELAGRVATIQALGGTGALKIGAEFLRGIDPAAKVLVSDPTWENHTALFSRAGFNVGTYRYYSAGQGGLDFEGMLSDIGQAAPGTIVVLHACCHNPTGYDLDAGQWRQVADAVQERQLVPFLDMAYQGFAQGVAADGAVVAEFAKRPLALLVSTSFSKSLSLYGERVGALSIVASDADEAARVLSQAKVCVRTLYSNPPTHGALAASLVLTDPDLRELWDAELGQMRDRIKALRGELVEALRQAGASRDFSFFAEQVGMFSYTGLGAEQMRQLRERYAVYGTDAGRICVAALNRGNLPMVAQAIAAVV
ncbi:MAG: aspartate/tyrosine/aromatic aminotransferase [Propionibacteriaceae bacterium]|jgi:aromatic-amino-acid transaminase|nr:aspartate/tyrosine/aromatic aminotransferase [Propionibacteriaceae bacterium]